MFRPYLPTDGGGGGGRGGGPVQLRYWAVIIVCCLPAPSFIQRVPQRRVCLDMCTCCHTEIEVADETCSYPLAIYQHRVNQSYHWPSFLPPPFLLFVSLPFTFTHGKFRDELNFEWQQRSEEKKKKKKKKGKQNKTLSNKIRLWKTKHDSGKQNKTRLWKTKTRLCQTKQDSGKQNNKNSMYKTRGQLPGCSVHTRRQMGARPTEILGCDYRLLLAGPSFIQTCTTATGLLRQVCLLPHRDRSCRWHLLLPSRDIPTPGQPVLSLTLLPTPSLPPLRLSSLHFHMRQTER